MSHLAFKHISSRPKLASFSPVGPLHDPSTGGATSGSRLRFAGVGESRLGGGEVGSSGAPAAALGGAGPLVAGEDGWVRAVLGEGKKTFLGPVRGFQKWLVRFWEKGEKGEALRNCKE